MASFSRSNRVRDRAASLNEQLISLLPRLTSLSFNEFVAANQRFSFVEESINRSAQLYVFREKQRIAEPMNTLTEGMTYDDLREFSEEIAKLPPPSPPPEGAEPARVAKGREAAARHRCGFCHNPDLSGHDQIPRIGAQREDYLVKALAGYKTGERRGYDPAMVEVAQGMSEAEIADVAYYLAHWR